MATAEEDRALVALYEMLRNKNDRETKFSRLDADAQREYKRRKQAERRAALRSAAAEGSPMPTADAIRDALADVALRMLSMDHPAAADIRKRLAECFPGRAAVPTTVTRKAKSGQLKPRLLRSA